MEGAGVAKNDRWFSWPEHTTSDRVSTKFRHALNFSDRSCTIHFFQIACKIAKYSPKHHVSIDGSRRRRFSHRDFSPTYYHDILAQFEVPTGITCVIFHVQHRRIIYHVQLCLSAQVVITADRLAAH
jgi:predicted NodU family carbamoyl transferase